MSPRKARRCRLCTGFACVQARRRRSRHRHERGRREDRRGPRRLHQEGRERLSRLNLLQKRSRQSLRLWLRRYSPINELLRPRTRSGVMATSPRRSRRILVKKPFRRIIGSSVYTLCYLSSVTVLDTISLLPLTWYRSRSMNDGAGSAKRLQSRESLTVTKCYVVTRDAIVFTRLTVREPAQI